MGFKYSYTANDMSSTVRVINSIKSDVCDSRSDGFIQWGAKQDLWRLKWILDQVIKDCPHFSSTEDDWLREEEKKKVIRILKNDFQ
jgi:tellurite resistance protein